MKSGSHVLDLLEISQKCKGFLGGENYNSTNQSVSTGKSYSETLSEDREKMPHLDWTQAINLSMPVNAAITLLTAVELSKERCCMYAAPEIWARAAARASTAPFSSMSS